MIVKLGIAWIIVIVGVLLSGCSPSSSGRQTNVQKSTAIIMPQKDRVYDCAGNSLYALCRKSGIHISYEQCLKLLPMRREGNSMLEFKGVLESIGFEVQAQRITIDELANIRVPAILLALSVETPEETESQVVQGHYLVVWPLDAESVEILDYPREPTVLFTDSWISHLRSIGVKNIPVLLCGMRGQASDEMLLPVSNRK